METKPTKAERKRQALLTALVKLAELYPVCFAADASAPHRPLKIGIHRDLRERGASAADAYALKLYARREAYQTALIAGGPRYDLDGNPTGEVTVGEMAAAKVALADIETRIRTAHERDEAERIDREKTNAEEGGKACEAIRAARIQREAKATGRLGLADLKRAAQARKAAQQAA